MTATRIYLGLSVLIWLPYGLYLVFEPGYLAEAAGVVGTTPTGTTELRAMYGGLQAAVGVFAGFALLRPGHAPKVLLSVAFLAGGLFGARLLGLLLDGGGSTYTLGALGFEGLYTAASIALYRRDGGTPPGSA